ncbi:MULTISPECIES: AfsR/SARP family transcriptional regulator [Saccharothrix]|uniref:AfsR/SARP family transcriptional regulator n=1 Tax=Saccharothrix TaxID=2071 RepID=UPI00093CB478|nr:BTAD domain-containing putative transcriptional regulator [Saccharothrix sp. CB00851]OKI25742.1 transcriptional regulator, SARP family protein [Saccharothrix sp. CB00851]
MYFGILGPLQVVGDAGPVRLDAHLQRVLLAVLLCRSNRPVPTAVLQDALWGDRPPKSAGKVLQVYVHRLRRALGDPERIRHDRSAYALVVHPGELDADRFAALVDQARQADDPAVAADLLRSALALWRGRPLADLGDVPVLGADVDRLDEQRLAVWEDRAEAELALGRHASIAAELAALVEEHPLRERLRARLMLALYRSGRQAEALAVYRAGRRVLADEVGVDPGPELRELHAAVLRAGPELDARPAAPSLPVPRQLPLPPGPFSGRTAELARLDQALTATRNNTGPAAETIPISVIGGAGGIGKTWLALHWAHRHAERFPDGQLFVDLHGFSPTEHPGKPEAAVFGFLTALGVAPDRVPSDLDAKASLFRSLVSGRRMLVVLDNAATADQVVPLLPGSPTCTVLVTGRAKLASLIERYGARHVQLDVLSRPEAAALLTERLGAGRVAAEPGATDELVELCGRYPLALSVMARHACTRPQVPLAEFAAELRDLGLDLLDDDDPDAGLPVVLSWSLRHLTAEQRTVFALLGIAPGPDIGLPAAVALTGLTTARTHKVLRALEDASLLDRHPQGRYAMHDLVRAYAATLAQDLPEEPRDAALGRVVDFYLHTVHAADRLLNVHRRPIRLDPPAPGVEPHPLPDMPAALAWLDAEHAHLLAAQRTAAAHRRHQAVWQLAWTLTSFHFRRAHRRDNLTVWRAALDAVTHLADPITHMRVHRRLGAAYANTGRHEEAVGHLEQALALAERHHDRTEQAHTRNALAAAWERRGDHRQALEHGLLSLRLYRDLGLTVREARALNYVGWYFAHVGEHDTGRRYCQAALVVYRRLDDPEGEGGTLDSLGYIDHHTGHHERAIQHYHEALTIFRALGHTYAVANALDNMGHPHLALGRHHQARAAWQEALQWYRAQGRDTDTERVQRQLHDLDHVVTTEPMGRRGSTGSST